MLTRQQLSSGKYALSVKLLAATSPKIEDRKTEKFKMG